MHQGEFMFSHFMGYLLVSTFWRCVIFRIGKFAVCASFGRRTHPLLQCNLRPLDDLTPVVKFLAREVAQLLRAHLLHIGA